MAVSGKDRRGLVENLRTLRTRVGRLEHQNAQLVKAERELQTSLEQVKTAFEDSPLGLYRTTPDGRILMANSALVNMLGYRSLDELSRRNLENEGYEPACPRETFKERIESEGKVIGLESAWKKSDGTTLHVRESAQAVRDERGNTLYYQGSVEDITEHREIKKALRESEEMFGALARNLSEGVNIVDENLGFLFANPTGEKIFGVGPDGLAGRNLREFLSDESLATVEEHRKKRREGIASTYDLEISRPDGHKRQLIVTGTPRLSHDGKYVGSLAVFFDVTERKQAEQALRQAHDELETRVQERTSELRRANETLQAEIAERLDAERQIRERARIIDSTTDSVIKTDANGIVTLWNGGAEKIFGYTSAEMVGRPVSVLYRPQDRGVLDEIVQALLSGKEIVTKEVTCVRKDGSLVELAISLLPLKDDGGNVTDFVGISRDDTERKKAQEALRQSENGYRTVIENAGEGIIVVQDGKLRFVNARHTLVTGRCPEESTSRPFVEFVHPDDQEKVAAIHTARLRGEPVPKTYEFRVIDKEGQTKWLENNGVVIEWDGRPASLNFLRDITDRKVAEEALRESEERFRKVFEEGPIGMVLTSRDMKFFSANPAFCRMLGYTPEEMSGKTFLDVTHPAHRGTDRQNIEKMWRGEIQQYATKKRYLAKNGGVRWGSLSASLTRGQDGEPLYALAMVEDITEREQAQQTLRETTALLESVLAHTHMHVACLDAQFNFVRVNRAYAQADGREPSFFAGRNYFDLYPNAENEAIFRKVVEIGVPYSAWARPFEYAGHPERGVTYWDWTLVPIKQQNGAVCGLVLTLADVTKRQQAEQALRESEGHYHSLAKLSPVGIFRTDVQGDCTYVNERWCEMAGMSPEEGLGKGWTKALYPEDRQRIYDAWRRSVQEQKPFSEEYRYCRPDGTVTWVQGRATSEKNIDGHVVGCVWTVSDITELKQAEQALREREATLTSIFQAAPVGIGLERGPVLVRVNDTICHMLGYCAEELVGQRAQMFYPRPEDYEPVRTETRRQISEKGKGTVETQWKRKDGRIIDVLLSTTVLDPADFDKGVTFTALDITERKAAEQALKESEEKFRSLAEQSPNMIFINKNGRVVYANRKCEETMGYTREEFYSPDFDFRVLFAPESVDAIKGYFARHLQGQEVGAYDSCLINRTRRRIEAINTCKLIPYEGGTAILGIVTDITERKKAERALRESRERLEILFESAPDAIYVMDPEGRFVDGNRAAEEMVGFTKAELIGKTLAESGLLSAEDLPKATANLRGVAGGKSSGPREYAVERKDGTRIAAEIRTFPVTIGGRTLTLGIARDITARKRAEDELRKSERRYRLLVDSASDSIFLMDLNGRFMDVNPAACDSLGRTREEMLSLSASDIDSDWPKQNLSRFLSGLAPGEPATVEGTHRRKNKTSFPVEIRCTKIEADGKQVMLAVARDITLRRRAEESLRKKADTASHENKVHVSGIDIEWDCRQGRCTFEKLAVAMMWVDTTLAGLMSGVQAMVGTERFGLALQAEGRKSVEDDWRVISQFSDFRKGFEAIANIGAVAGWGDWKLIEMDAEKRECVFRVWNSWESLYQKALGVCWGSGMLAGKLAGYCSMLFKANCWADQTAFIARGDAFDEFRVHVSQRSLEKEAENLLATDKATRADMAVTLQKLQSEIARRTNVEHALRESEQQMELALRGADLGTWDWNVQTGETAFNRRWAEMLGYEPGEIEPHIRAWENLVHPDDMPGVRETLNAHFAGKKDFYETEHRMRHKSGDWVWVLDKGKVIDRDADGKPLRACGTHLDITERKRAQQRLIDDREQLKSLASQLSLTEERERHRLATALHDHIGQSLVISKIKLDRLRKSSASAELVPALDEVAACLGQVISDTRTLTFDLSYPILYELGFEAAVAEWLTEHIQEKHGIDTRFEDDGQSKPLDDDIRALLFRSVRELLINVVKHARARRVKVATRRVKDRIRISVEDDGVGFDPEEVTAMAARRAEFGLFSIRKRLEQFGGLFEVVSAPGRGTRIAMTAPLKCKANGTRAGSEHER